MPARARLHLAEGDASAAERLFSEAVRAWSAVGAPYEAAVARLGLADAHRALGSDHQAALELRAARTALDRIEGESSTDLAARAAHHERPDKAGTQARNVFRREGDYWLVVFGERTVRVRDLKGMRYLARLFADPEREFHVLDLVAAETTTTGLNERGPARDGIALGDAGEMLDAQAKDAYHRRLVEIDEDIDDAHTSGDALREEQAEVERDFLVRELSRAVGLGGRGRRAGSASERGRAAVTRAVRQAVTRLTAHHPELGEHLDRTIRTGTYCSYRPDPRLPADWDL